MEYATLVAVSVDLESVIDSPLQIKPLLKELYGVEVAIPFRVDDYVFEHLHLYLFHVGWVTHHQRFAALVYLLAYDSIVELHENLKSDSDDFQDPRGHLCWDLLFYGRSEGHDLAGKVDWVGAIEHLDWVNKSIQDLVVITAILVL